MIGYDEVVMLGYRDSGMAGAESNANPDSFAQAPLDEAVGRLVSHEFALTQAPEALSFAMSNPTEVMKVVIRDA